MKNLWIAIIILSCFAVGCKKDDANATVSPSPAGSATPIATPSASPDATPAASPDATPAAAPTKPSQADSDRVMGAWKVDLTKSKLPANISAEEKEKAGKVTVAIKPDGTYEQNGGATPDKGTWALQGDKLVLTSTSGGSAPTFKVAADNSTLSIEQGETSLVMVKA